MMDASVEQLLQVPDVGPVVAESIHTFFAQPHNREVVEQLRAAASLARRRARPAAPLPLAGKTFVLTGTLPTLSRDEAKALLEAAGAKVAGRSARRRTTSSPAPRRAASWTRPASWACRCSTRRAAARCWRRGRERYSPGRRPGRHQDRDRGAGCSGRIRAARAHAHAAGRLRGHAGRHRPSGRTAEARLGATGLPLGVGMPGSLSPLTGRVRNANSTVLNGQPLRRTCSACWRPLRLENDANCLALSEATDGAGAGAEVVFAAILGTGVGAGIAVRGRVLHGCNGIAGEWGHNRLPLLAGEPRAAAPAGAAGPTAWRPGCRAPRSRPTTRWRAAAR
jgi:hypothetical protein